jgi:putative phage-type endonuclease
MKSLMSLPTNLPALNRSLTTSANTARSYTRVDLAQGTRDWHYWRKEGIGASDAASIMGENPFKSLSAVLAEKLANVVVRAQNARMALGVALEPNARRDYCEMFEVDVEPVCVQSVEHPWMRASLDGLSSDGGKVVEIKCGRAAYWLTAKRGKPPAYYVAQLQHILAVTGLPRIDFVCHFPPLFPIRLTIERDDEYIARLFEKESAFWTLVQVLRGSPCRSAPIMERAA